MRAPSLFLLITLTLSTLLHAWTKEDHEIFRLNDEVLSTEGLDTTFYSFLGVPASADLDEINKQYRKRSKQLHPDKAIPSLLAKLSAPKPTSNPGDKKSKPGVHVQKGPSQKARTQVIAGANERYARLGVVASILRGPERDRYDHFLKNGFPRWRGTGYYYQRLRPGLASVLLGLLVVFGGAAHYSALYIGWKRQREFVQRYIGHARRTAFGNESGIPGLTTGMGQTGTAVDTGTPPPEAMQEAAMPMNRQQRRMQEKEGKRKDIGKAAVKTARKEGISRPVNAEVMTGPQGNRKKVVAQNGKVLIVDSVGNVFLEEETVEGAVHEFLLDVSLIPPFFCPALPFIMAHVSHH